MTNNKWVQKSRERALAVPSRHLILRGTHGGFES